MRGLVGVDLGGTKTAAALVEDGDVLRRALAPTPAQDGPDAVLALVARLVSEVADGAPYGLGVGTAGVVDPATGTVTTATDHLRGWAGTPVRDRLAGRLGLAPDTVVVANDAHAHALAEARVGAGRGHRTVLVVAAGTGVGGALVEGGRVLVGAHGAGGHLGHVPSAAAAGLPCRCGRTGHLEAVASGEGLAALARRYGVTVRDGREVAALAASGDRQAGRALDTAAAALGEAVGGWLGALDPDVVVLTGGVTGAGERWWRGVRDAAARTALPVAASTPLVPALLGSDSGVVGAALLSERAASGSVAVR